jgi:hypothetical protein
MYFYFKQPLPVLAAGMEVPIVIPNIICNLPLSVGYISGCFICDSIKLIIIK